MSAQISAFDTAAISASLIENYPDLDASAADALIAAGNIIDIPAGQVLFTSCKPCLGVMWLLDGCVRVHRLAADGREVTLYRVQPGDLCMMSLYTLYHGGVYSAEACSETRMLGVAVPSKKMFELIDSAPGIRHLLLKHLTGRLQILAELVGANAFNRLELRLACLLGQHFGHNADVAITHQELANDLGCTREVVSRLLKEFERMGCIRLHRGHIQLMSPEALARLSGGNE